MNENKTWIDEIWEKIDKKLKPVSQSSFDKLPYTTENGKYVEKKSGDGVCWWTNGFWPGLMWLMYVGTKDEQYRKTAEHAEELLDEAFEDYDHLNHDVGFMWHISAGVNYRLFGGHKSKVRAMHAADILAARFNSSGKFIRAWNGDLFGRVIIDCMMNIPLLYWASHETGDPRYKYVAMSHADTTLKTHLRADGSVHHIVDLDIVTGEPVEAFGGQGYELGSAWSRGQSWALYGYILSYIHTQKQVYLDAAKRVAHYFIANTAEYGVPLCDFRAPQEPVIYDTTAGACAACGLIEIAKNVPEHEQHLYMKAALRILKALEKDFCDWSDKEDSILQKGTEAYHSPDSSKHIPIIYGDYFFTEAIYKLKGFDMLFW
ncbi:MAG: glycosyl hydrolase family 88 [Clostridia bacterium]|nr:glycosyl hydrolase family 88 [Clostridia bacterium]